MAFCRFAVYFKNVFVGVAVVIFVLAFQELAFHAMVMYTVIATGVKVSSTSLSMFSLMLYVGQPSLTQRTTQKRVTATDETRNTVIVYYRYRFIRQTLDRHTTNVITK